jgi:hypothetical protein
MTLRSRGRRSAEGILPPGISGVQNTGEMGRIVRSPPGALILATIRSLQEKVVLLESSLQCRYDGTTYKPGARWTPIKGLMCKCEIGGNVKCLVLTCCKY